MLLIATVLLEVGRHIAILMIGRFMQGLSAAVVWTSGLGLLTEIFGQKRYGEAIGYAQTAVSVGTTSAPLLGGLVYARGGYSAVSAMSVATVSVSIIMALIMVEPKPERPEPEEEGGTDDRACSGRRSQECEQVRRSDPPAGDVASPKANGPEEHTDERSPLIPKSFGDINEKKPAKWPAYPKLFSNSRILAAMCGIFTYSFVLINLEGTIPLFVKDTFHWNSAHAALTFLSWILPGFLGPLAGKGSDRFGPKWIAIGGLLFAVPPLILMRLVTQNILLHQLLLCGLLTLVGKLSRHTSVL